jgi:hypothetical protein
MGKYTIGGETAFTLLPEAPRVRVHLKSVETSQFNSNVERWCFVINDPDYENGNSEEDDATIRQASEDQIELYESVNLPKGPKIGKGTKLYKFLAGMHGAEIDEDTEIDIDDYVPGDYLADIEVVDKRAPAGDGSFRVALDEKGRPIKKNAVTKLRPIAKRKAGKTPIAPKRAKVETDVPEDDSDLDVDEDVD